VLLFAGQKPETETISIYYRSNCRTADRPGQLSQNWRIFIVSFPRYYHQFAKKNKGHATLTALFGG